MACERDDGALSLWNDWSKTSKKIAAAQFDFRSFSSLTLHSTFDERRSAMTGKSATTRARAKTVQCGKMKTTRNRKLKN